MFLEFSSQEYWSGLSFPFLLQGTLLTQGSNLGLLRCRQILYHLNDQGSPTYRYIYFIYGYLSTGQEAMVRTGHGTTDWY